MQKIIFWTCAYNSEKTVKRAINSVLSQTYSNLLYYIVDNGSTDLTGKIIHEMAQNDSRIIPLRNEQNMVWKKENTWIDIALKMNSDDIFCFLDADDAYKPDFCEKMLTFMKKNKLDIAACGNDFIDSISGNITNVRKLSTNLILYSQGFSYYFPVYHQFMRTTWAKAYRISVIKQFDPSRICCSGYGWDTIVTLENFRNASRVGILGESLHEYYVSKHSLSYQFDSQRIKSPELLYRAAQRFLMDKCSQITPSNQDFLLCVYFGDLVDALKILLNVEIPNYEKIKYLLNLLENEPMHLLLQANHLGESYGLLPHIQEQRLQMFSSLINWMLSLDDVDDELVERFCQLGELLCASIEDVRKWSLFRNLHIQYLFSVGRIAEARSLG